MPIGLINTSWGGTRIEPWTPAEAFSDYPKLRDIAEQVLWQTKEQTKGLEPLVPSLEAWTKAAREAQAKGQPVPPLPPLPASRLGDNSRPTTLYNGMVAGLLPFAIRGAIWYQGEANRADGMLYTEKMKALIAGWRKAWGQGDFPFYFVQLAPFRYDDKDLLLPELWEAQVAAMSIPATGMAVTNDIGNVADIHPKNKQDVGKRLALWALANTYGQVGLVYSGPLYKSMTVEGSAVRVSFDHVGGGLASRDSQPLTWFEIAGADGKFVKADAKIDGETVVVTSDQVAQPTAVRFAWNQAATPNLMNVNGLPASAFRTDGPLVQMRKAAATQLIEMAPALPTRPTPASRPSIQVVPAKPAPASRDAVPPKVAPAPDKPAGARKGTPHGPVNPAERSRAM